MDDQSEYYLRQAEAELELARTSISPDAVRSHYHRAGHFLDRAYSKGVEKLPPPIIRLSEEPDGR
jgi:hypothetical protein